MAVFVDRSQSKVKQTHCHPGLLSIFDIQLIIALVDDPRVCSADVLRNFCCIMIWTNLGMRRSCLKFFMVSNFVSVFFLFSLQTPSESSPEKEQCSRNPR